MKDLIIKTKSVILGITVLFVLLTMVNCSNDKHKSKDCSTFQELQDPTNDTLSDWSNVKPNELMVSFVNIDNKYPKSVNPDLTDAQKTQKLTAWRGETVSSQILLWSASNVNHIEVEIEKFKTSDGVVFPTVNISSHFVRYVMTDEFAGGCGHRKPEDFSSALAPDMLDNIECIDLEAKTVRPVWITVNVPSNIKAGLYEGKIKFKSDKHHTKTLNLQLDVLQNILPPPSDWTYHLDLWQHPSAVARVDSLEMWSDEHFEHLKPVMQMLADAGQKVITTNVNKDPWNVQTYDPYADMIIWTKDKKGNWSYDYTNFDKWVQLMMSLGIDKMINAYSMATWNDELHYYDENSEKNLTVKAVPGTKEFEIMWGSFLPDFSNHLKQKGWLEITNIAMDERSPAVMKATLETLNKYAPELGVSLADNHKSYKQYPFINDMSVAAGNQVDKEDLERRKKNNKVTTFYICCSDEFPNTLTFSDSAEATYTAWYAAANDLDGMLRWSFNSWVENPLTDSRFRTWPAGDTYIVYPDARSSIRFERLKEGVQDFEKIKIIKNQLQKENTPEASEKLAKLNAALSKLATTERTTTWNEDLNAAKQMLNQ